MSKHFTKKEFECKCGCGFDNHSPKLVEALEALRELIGQPIIINCACRCPKHNADVGGVKNSYHIQGIAADIKVKNMSPLKLKTYAEKVNDFKNGGIGLYDSFLHVDVRPKKARWDYRTKK